MHRERPFFKDLTEFMSSGKVVVIVLEAEGAIAKWRETMGATDPETAFTLAEQEHPDLIISDIAMPALDGFTLLKGLKSNKATCEIPLVLLTGSDKMSDVEEGFVSARRPIS